jgi:HAD superfamily phosphatase (TIGR01668 family)
VARDLELPFTTAAGKPRRSALRRVLQQLNLPHHQVALVGDRLFTDVIAGNRLGLFTVLVRPIDPDGRPCRQDHLQRLELRLARLVGTALG